MTLPRRVDEIDSAWLGPILAARRLVEPDAPIAVAAERIGADRGMTGVIARVRWRLETRPATTGTLIAKLPDAAADPNRCAREVHFYRELARDCGVRVPHALHVDVDETASTVVLLLEDVRGDSGDVLDGCSVDEAATIVTEIARMHARWWDHPMVTDRRPAWLPWWGQGTAGSVTPHRRRAERYRRRLGPFLARYGEAAPAGLDRVAHGLADRFETLLGVVQRLPATLIHADLHLDNMIFPVPSERPGVTVLDWQTVSAGPGLYDVARLLTETLQGPGAHAAMFDLLELYRERLRIEGSVHVEPRELRVAFRDMILRVLAGFISGYGGRTPESLCEREDAMIRQAMSSRGLAGAVIHTLSI